MSPLPLYYGQQMKERVRGVKEKIILRGDLDLDTLAGRTGQGAPGFDN